MVGCVEEQVGGEHLGDVCFSGDGERVSPGVRALGPPLDEQPGCLDPGVKGCERVLDRLLCPDWLFSEDRAFASSCEC